MEYDRVFITPRCAGWTAHHDERTLDLPGLRQLLGAAGAMSFRSVLDVLGRGEDGPDATQPSPNRLFLDDVEPA